jgi:hypothetical protein
MAPLDVRNAPLRTTRLVHACRAPPLHPFLWQLGQARVFRLGPPAALARRRKLVYCSRRDKGTTEHPGRLLVNEDAVVAALRAACAAARDCDDVVFFNHKAFSNNLTAIAAFFADAIGLISPHGGCLTNVNLMPCNAGVLEIMPLNRGDLTPTEPHWHVRAAAAARARARSRGRRSGGARPHLSPPRPPLPSQMLYMQAVFLEMRYWMLPIEAAQGTRDDMLVPLDHLTAIVTSMLSGAPG